MVVAHPKDDAYLTATIPKRIQLFETIQAEQQTRRLSLSPDPIKITLPDGTVKEGKKWQTTPFDIAREISKNLANNALIAKVNDVLWDMNRPLEEDAKLEIYKFEDDEGRDTFWHSSAHILGQVSSTFAFQSFLISIQFGLLILVMMMLMFFFCVCSLLRRSMDASFALDLALLEERFVPCLLFFMYAVFLVCLVLWGEKLISSELIPTKIELNVK
jgi:hypothetical protein